MILPIIAFLIQNFGSQNASQRATATLLSTCKGLTKAFAGLEEFASPLEEASQVMRASGFMASKRNPAGDVCYRYDHLDSCCKSV